MAKETKSKNTTSQKSEETQTPSYTGGSNFIKTLNNLKSLEGTAENNVSTYSRSAGKAVKPKQYNRGLIWN